MNYSQLVGAIATVVASFVGNCFAQTPDWLPSPGRAFAGVNGLVYAVAEWDPDGSGPLGTVLVLGGQFAEAGTVHARNVVTWDGNQFRPMPVELFGTVRSLAVYRGSLYAGGSFTINNAGAAPGVARWTGSAWEAVGGGLTGIFTSAPSVTKMVVFGDRLVVSGNFSAAGTLAEGYIAAWNGSQWQSMGGAGLTCPCNEMQVYNGRLYLSHCRGVFQYATPAWLDITPRDANTVWTLEHVLGVSGGMLMAVHNDQGAGNIYTQKWRYNGAGFVSMNSYLSRVSSILTLGSESYFAQPRLQYFQGGGAEGLVDRVSGGPSGPLGEFTGSVLTMGSYRGRLVAAGAMDTADRVPASGAVIRGVSSWERLWPGLSAAPGSLERAGGVVYATTQTLRDTRTQVNQLHHLGAAGWQTDLTQDFGSFSNLVIYRGQLFLCGELRPDGVTTSLASVQGARLQAVAGAPIASAQSFRAIVVRDEIVLVGKGVFAWNGASWRTLAEPASTQDQTSLYRLSTLGDQLYVGGRFTSFGGVPATNLVRWTGTAWEAVPGLSPTAVAALGTFGDSLVLAGSLPNDMRQGVWHWNGGAATLIGLLGSADSVTVLAEWQGRLIAGGSFSSLHLVHATNLAAWDGTRWQPMADSIDRPVTTLLAGSRSLAVGGRFWNINDEVSAYFGLYGTPCFADFNQDGGVDGADVEAFFTAWEAGDAVADVNADGGVDGSDSSDFFDAWETGVCD